MELIGIYTWVHLAGVIIGVGGAYVSDFLFIRSVRDGILSLKELSILSWASRLVWIGLIILILSGIGIFFTNSEHYLQADKFLAKQTIVLILFINGLIFHKLHMPLFRRHAESHFPSSEEFIGLRKWILVSGVISITSWTAALIIGAWRSMPYSYSEIIGVYLGLIILGTSIAYFIKNKILPNYQGR